MEIKLSESDGACVCAVSGDIDLYTAASLHRAWLDHAEKAKRPFIIDLRETAYLDSSGIGVLVQILADSRGKEIPFCLCNARGMAERLLHLGRMDAILPIAKDLLEATARVRNAKK